jgi:AcrR family transcriptional regulator
MIMNKSRREERRDATVNEIKEWAWKLMTEKGPANLSLREISRRMRMSSAALYCYFPNRNALLESLGMDAFASQVMALKNMCAMHPENDPLSRLRILGEGYRQWALEHPVQYALIFGAPIPGYQPKWENLIPYAQRSLLILLELISEAFEAGALVIRPDLFRLPDGLKSYLENLIVSRDYKITPQALYIGIMVWTRLHGLVSLELNGQLEILIGDPAAFFHNELDMFFRSFAAEK